MIGVVLCGGESRRMETDKGMIQSENGRWVQLAFNKLSSIVSNVVVSVNPSQRLEYGQHFAATVLVTDNAAIPVKGPLHGLLSVHTQYPHEDLLVLACDMVAMNHEALLLLTERYKQHHNKECYAFNATSGLQPLAGIYTASLLKRVWQQAHEGSLSKCSMKHILDISDVDLITVPEEWEVNFVNYNYKEDIDYQ